jgi:nicotinate phosphoribosyltransferase
MHQAPIDALAALYRGSLALATDLYQLTMAYGYWKTGLHEREAAFSMFFRQPPFTGGYAVTCGQEPLAELVAGVGFGSDDLAYLATLVGNDGAPLFEPGFLAALAALRPALDIDAMPEGSVAFPHEPIVRVRGPLWQCQLLETPLLNLVNFQTLIATKAARVCAAAGGPVIDFGLRRAQGIDGGVSASRAAYLGGCAGTSNVLAGKLYGIPVKGTHAHSWVMCFADEREAFRRYAEAMPNNCVFLVDTYDTLGGVEAAIEAGRELRARGHEMVGIRLDSGDLAALSRAARRMLDDAGFPDAVIVASNDLDEHIIASLRAQGAAIAVWGVGTKLVTGHDQPALGGVYKLAAIRDTSGAWRPRLKLSEQPIKISNPGVLQVRRYYRGARMVGDVLYDIGDPEPAGLAMHDIADPTRTRRIDAHDAHRDLLEPWFRAGVRVRAPEPLDVGRARCARELAALGSRSTRLLNPETYRVGLDHPLHERKLRLVAAARGDELALGGAA